MQKKSVSPEQADNFLPDGTWIHVFIEGGAREGEVWPRSKISDHIQKNGAEIAGEEAMKLQHGLFSGGVFIQTRGQPK